MAYADDDDSTLYVVVVNNEEQYAIWPNYKEIPAGWHSTGKIGPKTDCCAYVDQVWTDMRPKSLREKMGS